MPLSEEEMRLLQQMERALVEEDPKFASALRGPIVRGSRGKFVGAVALFLLGVVGLVAGAVTRTTWLGILSFVLMVGAATTALSLIRIGREQGERATESAEHEDHRFGHRLDDEG